MHEEHCQEELTNNKEGDFPKSLEQLQELLTSGEVEVRDEVETSSESPQSKETSISMTELEEAVADIEQFLRNQNKSEPE